MIQYLNEFLVVIITMVFALLSPGPDFAFILKQSVTHGKRTSIYTSIGLGIGVGFHVAYSILGIGFIISKSIILFNIVKFLGAAYLIYIGYKSLKSDGFKLQNQQASGVEPQGFKKAFLLGLLCNVLNPKAALFFISLFTVVINVNTPINIQIIYGVFCLFLTMLWFSILSIVLSQNAVRIFFNKFGKYFDRCIGGIFILLGLRIGFMER